MTQVGEGNCKYGHGVAVGVMTYSHRPSKITCSVGQKVRSFLEGGIPVIKFCFSEHYNFYGWVVERIFDKKNYPNLLIVIIIQMSTY